MDTQKVIVKIDAFTIKVFLIVVKNEKDKNKKDLWAYIHFV